MSKFYNAKTLVKERVEDGFSMPLNVYTGKKEENLMASVPNKVVEDVVSMTKNWVNSKGYIETKNMVDDFIKNRAKNVANPPTQEEIDKFFTRIQLDITKRYMEKGDLTSLIATEVVNEAFPEDISLKYFLKYRGSFEEIGLTGDSVPLLSQATGLNKTAHIKAYGLGFSQSLKNVLFNTFYEIAKVNDAVSDAYVDFRNYQTIGAIVTTTYTAKMKQAAVTTPSGQTPDYYLYKTLDLAEDTLRKLKDERTDREIDVPAISLLINSHDSKRINRVVNGQLNLFGKTPSANLPALPITNIIEYDRGINDGFTVGKKTISVPGVTAGKAYMFVPKEYFWVLVKRGLTMESSTGSALTLSQEDKAWYHIQGAYSELFFGSSVAGTSLADGYGAIVEITLPTA